jgi:Flp pilus assembly protein TadG
MRWKRLDFWHQQSGAISVAAAIGLALCLGFAALVVDLAHLYVVKGELQRTADAAALAGARGLWPDSLPSVPKDVMPPYIPNFSNGQSRALSVATSTNNKVNGAALPAGSVTVDLGHWSFANRTFTPVQDVTTNAVRVTATRTGVTNLFGRILRSTPLNLSATAIGVMGWASGVGKGTLPIAISKNWVVPGTVINVNFKPDPNDTGGWFSDPPDKASAAVFKDYIVNDSCPPLHIGDIIDLNNGNVVSAIHALQDELAAHQAAGVPWDVYLPVVDTDKFNQAQPIVGFVPFEITDVNGSLGLTGKIFGLGECFGATPGDSGSPQGTLTPPKLVF